LDETLRCANPSLSTDGISDSTEVELSLSAPFKICSGKIMQTSTKHNSLVLVTFVFRIMCKNTDCCLQKDPYAFNKMLVIYFIKETATFHENFQFMGAVNCPADVFVIIQLLLDILAPGTSKELVVSDFCYVVIFKL